MGARGRFGRRGLAVVGIAMAGLVVLGGTALARSSGPPGRWDVVVQGRGVPGNSANDLGLARTADGALHVAWSEQTSPSAEAIRQRKISAAGALGATTPIVAGWTEVSDPELVADRGLLHAFFGGRRSTNSADPNEGLIRAVSADGGASWTSAPIYNQNFVGAARTPSVTVASDGTTLQSWYGASEIWVHRGLEPGAPSRLFSAEAGLSEFGPTVVRDAAGRLWVSWCAFGTNAGGLYVRRGDPATGAPTTAQVRLPGSATPFGGKQYSTCNLERTAARRTPMVARVGGGVFVAGSAGYPTLSRVLVWRIDASGRIPGGAFVVGADGAFGHQTPMLAAAPDGRVWVAWLEARPGRAMIAARRSNRAGTEWGEPVRVRAPGAWLLGAINIAAQAGKLDVLGLMHTVSGVNSIQHTQLLPGLTLARAGTVTRPNGSVALSFRVTDAGDPVAGARVSAAGRGAEVTGANGIVTFVGSSTESVTLRLTASKAGYVDDHLAVRCC